MFTGLVEEQGRLLERSGERFRFAADLVLQDAHVDDSIAVNGCCLTVVEIGQEAAPANNSTSSGWWGADVSAETLARTSLGELAVGDPVNFERPMRYADRLGGHLVQGHVDGVGVIAQPGPDLRVSVPTDCYRYLVEKGSVTVDGVSLTCFDIRDDSFTVALIPHTMAVTTLGSCQVGDKVNIEVDVVAKYVERLVAPLAGATEASTAPASTGAAL